MLIYTKHGFRLHIVSQNQPVTFYVNVYNNYTQLRGCNDTLLLEAAKHDISIP